MKLLFLPGASGSTEFWQPVMQMLPEQYIKTVVAYSGFGGHSLNSSIQNFDDLQADVLSQIYEPTLVVAQSMGGIFAVQAALQKPEWVQGLVLVATSGGIDLSPFDVADWRQDYQLSFDVPDWFVEHQSHLDGRLAEIECPVLLIWGENDSISPVPVGQYLQSQLVNSDLYIVEHGQHDLANAYVDQVVELIKKLIRKIEQ